MTDESTEDDGPGDGRPADGAGPDDPLALAMAAGATVAAAARAAGVSESTAFRRRRDPAFLRRVSQLRADLVAVAAGKLAAQMGRAADVLHGLLASEAESVRLAAARLSLELPVKLVELHDLQARVEALEQGDDAWAGGRA